MWRNRIYVDVSAGNFDKDWNSLTKQLVAFGEIPFVLTFFAGNRFRVDVRTGNLYTDWISPAKPQVIFSEILSVSTFRLEIST